VVQAVARSSPHHAPALIEAGLGAKLLLQLDSGRPETIEAAVRAINTLCVASPRLATELATDHTLALLVRQRELPGGLTADGMAHGTWDLTGCSARGDLMIGRSEGT